MNAPLNSAQLRPAPRALTLDDKYTLSSGTAFMSGVQALVRLQRGKRNMIARARMRDGGTVRLHLR